IYFWHRFVTALSEGRYDKISFFSCAATLALVVYAHPFVALFAFPLCTGYMVCFAYDKRLPLFSFWSIGWMLVLAIILSAPYWYTAYMSRPLVDYKTAIMDGYNVVDNLRWDFSFWKLGLFVGLFLATLL